MTMDTPFTIDQFFSVFEDYNTFVFPAHLIFILMGLVAAFLIRPAAKTNHRIISGILGLLWLWVGLVYHILFFSGLNPVACMFGAVFVLQGLLILWIGLVRARLVFEITGSGWS